MLVDNEPPESYLMIKHFTVLESLYSWSSEVSCSL